MLRLSQPFLILVLLATQPGCSPETERQPAPVALNIEASYQLRFNDALVGHALFTLRTNPQSGSYRIEAFSVPAGKMAQADGHEVLEASTGRIDGARVRPAQFAFSVMDEGKLSVLSIEFDWAQQQLHLRDDKASSELTLLPNTQDRLSYLLLARQLALGGDVIRNLQIVTPQDTEQTGLELGEPASIEVPAGRYEAILVQRLAPVPGEVRRLWFNESVCPLPLRIEHPTGDNLVDMVLEHCTTVADAADQHAAG